MIPCPACGTRTSVLDSRPSHVQFVRRRRECPSCGRRFTTMEVPYEESARAIEILRWVAEGAPD